jgi:hypothetical protein
LGVPVSFDAVQDAGAAAGVQPYILDSTEGSVSGDINIARYFVRTQAEKVAAASALYSTGNKFQEAQIDSWLEYYTNGNPTVLPAILGAHLGNIYVISQSIAYILLLNLTFIKQPHEPLLSELH